MLMKALAVLVLTAAALWAAGVDVASVKETMTGAASNNTDTLTGRSDDWG